MTILESISTILNLALFLRHLGQECNFARDWNQITVCEFSLFKSLKCYVQAALVIRGLGICGFYYSRIRNQGKTANNEGINIVLVYL